MEILVLGEDQSMANVFVRLTSGFAEQEYPAPEAPAVLNQENCKYVPHVLGVMVNQPLSILNSDGILHNVKTQSRRNRAFNLGMPADMTEATRTFSRPEHIFPVKCNVHSWMTAYVGVLPHPFFDVTGQDGQFSIANLDPGTYELEVWHERLGTQTTTVTIAADESVEADFVFAQPEAAN